MDPFNSSYDFSCPDNIFFMGSGVQIYALFQNSNIMLKAKIYMANNTLSAKSEIVTIDFNFLTFESAYETIKNLINVLMEKSRVSENFFLF